MQSPTIEQGSLATRALALLKKDKRPLLDIHKATGLPFHWLRKFKAGEIQDPSVNKVQKLYEKLSGSKLAL